MTVHETLAPSRIADPAGAAPVGDLRALDGPRALAILMFRDWHDGPCGQARVFDLLCDTLGSDAGQAAFDAWSECLDSLARHARRPLVRHGLGCNCVGSDEAVVAQLFQSAATAAREDTLMILALVVPADRGLLLLQSAERAGFTLMRVASKLRGASSHDAHQVLH